MSAVRNTALEAFVAQLGNELVLAQVLIRGQGEGFELRHIEDRKAADLKEVPISTLRNIAQFTLQGAFRPLKSAPNLQSGWRAFASNRAELEFALNCLYPGAIADWFAAQRRHPPVTDFREFTARQTGMYRITAMLTDAQAAPVIRAGCHKRFCLKRRLWTVPGQPTDDPAEKSLIPCLEPCAVLLEFARTSMRIEQKTPAASDVAPEKPSSNVREADFANPANPRRLQLLREKGLRPD
jgi:hypothetical protein